jgi:hypothetical protein
MSLQYNWARCSNGDSDFSHRGTIVGDGQQDVEDNGLGERKLKILKNDIVELCWTVDNGTIRLSRNVGNCQIYVA